MPDDIYDDSLDLDDLDESVNDDAVDEHEGEPTYEHDFDPDGTLEDND